MNLTSRETWTFPTFLQLFASAEQPYCRGNPGRRSASRQRAGGPPGRGHAGARWLQATAARFRQPGRHPLHPLRQDAGTCRTPMTPTRCAQRAHELDRCAGRLDMDACGAYPRVAKPRPRGPRPWPGLRPGKGHAGCVCEVPGAARCWPSSVAEVGGLSVGLPMLPGKPGPEAVEFEPAISGSTCPCPRR
jgi:hypothetical protein